MFDDPRGVRAALAEAAARLGGAGGLHDDRGRLRMALIAASLVLAGAWIRPGAGARASGAKTISALPSPPRREPTVAAAQGQPSGRRCSAPATPAARPAVEPDLAYGAYQRGYFLTALAEATRRVDEKGDPKAMTLLGELYADGVGVAQNDAKAVEWYRLAAARGDRDGMFALAMFNIDRTRRAA